MANLLKFIDKLDDIIYEPIKLTCDYLRQPMQNWDAAREQERVAFEQKMQQEMALFEIDLDYKRTDRQAYERERNAQIDEMIKTAEKDRQQAIFEAIKQYQLDMAEAAKSMQASIGNMSLELRERAQNLVFTKTKEYTQIQKEAKHEAMEELKQITAEFPEGSNARKIMEQAVNQQLVDIITTTSDFIKGMKNDMEKIYHNIDDIGKGTIEFTQKMLSPIMAKAVKSLENKQLIE